MKNIMTACGILMLCLVMGSCSKEDIPLYQQSSTVYINEFFRNYTFIEHPDKAEIGFDTVKIPLLISGSAMDYDREVLMEVVTDDSMHTATPDMYSLCKGFIPANQYKGYAPIRVNYTPALDDSSYSIQLRLIPSKDFPGVDLERIVFGLNITNRITQPSNWYALEPYFGAYSNSWYRFILKETGLTSIPYLVKDGSFDDWNPDPETWTMTLYELKAYVATVRESLQKYNQKHPDNHLKHEDGEEKGKEIVMPTPQN